RRDELAHRLGRLDVRSLLDLLLQVLVEARGRGQRHPLGVVDHLGIDVLARAVHAQAQPAARLAREPDANAPLAPSAMIAQGFHGSPLLLLAFLAQDMLALVADALALVGLGAPLGAD